MTSESNPPEPTIEQLEEVNRQHKRDLKLLSHMTEAQFQNFKKNISIGSLENITKAEAYDLLMSMLALNQHLTELAKAKKGIKIGNQNKG